MKKLAAIFLVILVAVAYSACGSAPAASDAMPQPSVAAADNNSTEYKASTTSAEVQKLPTDKKIVRNARLDIEADNAQTAYSSLKDWVADNGGYEFASQTGKEGSYWTVTAQLKISPGLLDAFIEYVRTQGELVNCFVTSTDITDQYVDAQIRLDSAKKSLDKYYEFLSRAATIDDSLRVQNEIDRLTADIEAYEGKLKLWDSQVAESTIDLTIREKQDPVKVKKVVNWNAITLADMFDLAKNGFMTVVNTIVALLQWVLIAIVAISPIIVIGGILLFIRKRRKKNKKPAEIQDKPHP